jgi:hypothetical protein
MKRAKAYVLDVATEGLRHRVCGEHRRVTADNEAT